MSQLNPGMVSQQTSGMFYREYFEQEDGRVLNQDQLVSLRAERLPWDQYSISQQSNTTGSQDAFIDFNGRVILVRRDSDIAHDILSPLGGKIERGVPLAESLRVKVKEETNLDVSDLRLLGEARMFWLAEGSERYPKGADTPTKVFYVKGQGDLVLGKGLRKPIFVSPEDYHAPGFRESLHSYTKDFMDIVVPLLGSTPLS